MAVNGRKCADSNQENTESKQKADGRQAQSKQKADGKQVKSRQKASRKQYLTQTLGK
jgi:hypothetical protein